MQEGVVQALRGQRAQIHVRWETLLRTERVTSPMANPDTLVYLIDSTLDELFSVLPTLDSNRRSHRGSTECPCGRNPLLAYFHAGEQVILEALVLIQAVTPNLVPADRDAAVTELRGLMRLLANREIKAFCAVCQYRTGEHDSPGRLQSCAHHGPTALS